MGKIKMALAAMALALGVPAGVIAGTTGAANAASWSYESTAVCGGGTACQVWWRTTRGRASMVFEYFWDGQFGELPPYETNCDQATCWYSLVGYASAPVGWIASSEGALVYITQVTGGEIYN